MATSIEKKSEEVRKQLLMLREVTEMTGGVHEAQLNQIKYWGLLVFQLVPTKGFSVKVNSEEKEVLYELKGGKLHNKTGKLSFKWLVSAVAQLDVALHDLLGDDWKVTIIHNGKIQYHGERKSTKREIDERREQYRRSRSSRRR